MAAEKEHCPLFDTPRWVRAWEASLRMLVDAAVFVGEGQRHGGARGGGGLQHVCVGKSAAAYFA